MNVSEAVERRVSIRAFKPDPVPKAVVAEILERASRAPSGGNLQPWRVYALAGRPLAELKAIMGAHPGGETMEYDVYPPNLWEPFRTRRFQNGEELYATIGLAREDRAKRLEQHARNGQFFGAPVGLFFCLDRKLGPPQWADMGALLQNVMLLAVERGLDTCPQEYWARFPETVRRFIDLPDDHMLFSGMALGYRDPDAPINRMRAGREPMDIWCELRGWED